MIFIVRHGCLPKATRLIGHLYDLHGFRLPDDASTAASMTSHCPPRAGTQWVGHLAATATNWACMWRHASPMLGGNTCFTEV